MSKKNKKSSNPEKNNKKQDSDVREGEASEQIAPLQDDTNIVFFSAYDKDELSVNPEPYLYGTMNRGDEESNIVLVDDYAEETPIPVPKPIVPEKPRKAPEKRKKQKKQPQNVDSDAKKTQQKPSEPVPSEAVKPNTESIPLKQTVPHSTETEQTVVTQTVTEQVEPEQHEAKVHSGESKEKMTQIIRKVAIVLACIVFIWSLFDIVSRLVGYRKAETIYDHMQSIFYNGVDKNDVIRMDGPSMNDRPTVDLYTALSEEYAGKTVYKEERHSEFVKMLPRLEQLNKINGDFLGWIKINGTRIDYPVVKGIDNEYYLTHTFDGSVLKSGSVFADYHNNTLVTENRNTVIYGHNMKDGSMFSSLMEFNEEDVFRNGKIKLYTKDGIFEYTPFSVHVADPDYPFFQTVFTDDNDYLDYLKDMQSKSIYKSGVSLRASDKVITLMTCTNTIVNRRLVVHAVLTSQAN
jgi:sortase, SrtB family